MWEAKHKDSYVLLQRNRLLSAQVSQLEDALRTLAE
jgi:hypothetical protein